MTQKFVSCAVQIDFSIKFVGVFMQLPSLHNSL